MPNRCTRPAAFKRAPLASAIITALFITPAMAQEADEDRAIELPSIDVTAEAGREAAVAPVDGYVAERSTTGTKTGTPLIETPQSVSVVSSEQLEDQAVSDLGEALRYTPGVRGEIFGFEPRLTFLRIRGFDATETGLFRDNLKLSNPGFAVGYNLEPYGAERIEALRGPASVLYGQASPGGLINYVSKRPTFEPVREVGMEVGNDDHRQAYFDIGGANPHNDTLALRLTGLIKDSDTQVDFVEDDRVYFAPALTWQPSPDTSLTLLTHYQEDETKSSQRLPAEGTLEPNPFGDIAVDRFLGEPDVDRYERDEWALGYEFSHDFNDNLTLRQNLRRYSNEVDDITVFTSALQADKRTISRSLFESFGDVDGLNVDTQLQLNAATGPVGHKVLLGIDYQDVDSSSVQTFGAAPDLDIFDPVYGSPVSDAPVFKDTDSDLEQLGVYLQDQIRFRNWALAVGGRYDTADVKVDDNLAGTEDSRDDDEFSGRVGLVYLSDIGLAPYASYSESFLPLAGTDTEGKAFEPETAYQYEVGLRYQPGASNSYISVAYFDLTREDFITSDPVTFIDFQQGEANSTGVEIEARGSFDFGLDLIATYTYTDAEVKESVVAEEEGEQLALVPEHEASVWADYTLQTTQFRGLGFGLGVRFIGDRVGDTSGAENDIELDDQTLVDAAIHYTYKDLRLAINAHNVFDEEYAATAFSAGQDFSNYGETRTLTGSVTYNF